MSDLVLTQQRDNLFEITLNRPDKRNAINSEMYAAFDTAVSEANRLTDIRAVLIRGAGPAFSAGIDVTDFMRLPEKYGPEWPKRARRITDDYQAVLHQPGTPGAAHHRPAARLLPGSGPGTGPGL